MAQNSPTKADIVATLDKIVTRVLYVDRQAKAIVERLSRAEFMWHESTAASQRLRVETRQVLQDVVAMLNQADPLLHDEEEEGPTAPSTPTNPNPWSEKAAIEIGMNNTAVDQADPGSSSQQYGRK
ncbi:Hypothetical protein NCS54_01370500 [Fusarium falciforme]|uniref:Hypothetical protein n=1 Tax=Fusarium falciforme TaxID=195108 RepID=UPI00230050AC|nr:Hypothetical protein NCS54_01370500 [Fusarium falciforme]WAO96046.1 Hypothetical protein NCS54_01370500 [Fusarium falciforme]